MTDAREALHGHSAVALATREADEAHRAGAHGADADLVLDDVLVEDVSIDGMCGVY